MYGKKVKLRIIFISSVFITLILSVYIILKLLDDNIVYFKSPTEIKQLSEIDKKKIRVGGMVKKDSINFEQESISFIITDFKNDLAVTFSGSVPNLFQEEKGVVAEGFLKDQNFFVADKILAKHDENYMPPEVSKSLGN
jgi:cytochrome c-type biogenesis protein CcmE